jgi:TolB-like protein/tetratricopeptide (TPR) repeat protein
MNAERWQQVKAIFHGAVESDPAARAEFLRESCGDDQELQREVASLLASDQDPGSLLENPVVGAGAMAAAVPAYRTDPTIPISPDAALPERYEILGELGRGGMGIVYKARDRETGEVMALKILKPEIAADLGIIERFKNELRLAHRITHHNVARLYEFHRAGDTVYLSMEYVKGESLRALLHRTGKLDVARGLDIARQLAAGLAEAHRQSIAHRDLKPGNIMLTASGEVKVLDFGISRCYAADATATGGFIGTPAYMAPEQAEEKPTDHRTDIYALGLILYEMFTGTKAFAGDTPVSLALKQVRGRPQPPHMLAPDLPVHIEQAILKCLEKNPADRFQSVEELLRRLEGGAPGPAAPPSHRRTVRRRWLLAGVTAVVLAAGVGAVWLVAPGMSPRPAHDMPSVAVLPFADMSAEKNQEYFSEGIAEELRDALANVPGLRVTGRISSSQVKGEDFGRIGKTLKVATILQGSVRKQGNRARIGVQLIKAVDGSQLWSETFDREMNDILAVQQEIARAVTGALKITLLAGRTPAPSAKSTSVEAHNAYLQGRYFLGRDTRESRVNAVSNFEQAIKLDPGYAPAWVWLGQSRMAQAGSGDIPATEGYRNAREAIDHALMLDPDLGDAHSAMGEIKMLQDWDWSGAEVSYQRALKLEPGDAGVLRGAGSLARMLGRLDESIGLYRRAIEIDPLFGRRNLGLALLYAGRLEESKAAYGKALELNPEMAVAHAMLCRIYLAQGRPQEALDEAEKVNHAAWRPYALALAYHALGRKKESDAKLAELIEFPTGAHWLVAGVYAYRGETDQAFQWLERCYTERDPGLTEMKADPLLKSLRHDPRYQALLKKMGLPL